MGYLEWSGKKALVFLLPVYTTVHIITSMPFLPSSVWFFCTIICGICSAIVFWLFSGLFVLLCYLLVSVGWNELWVLLLCHLPWLKNEQFLSQPSRHHRNPWQWKLLNAILMFIVLDFWIFCQNCDVKVWILVPMLNHHHLNFVSDYFCPFWLNINWPFVFFYMQMKFYTTCLLQSPNVCF